MRKLFAFVIRNFGMGEFLFLTGMFMFYSGVSVLLSHPWAQAACGFVLIAVGFIVGREGK